MPTCFVTVGSTQFDALIEAVMSPQTRITLSKSLGIDQLLIQCGAGKAIDSFLPEGLQGSDKGCFVLDDGFKVEFYRYKESILDDMKAAKLIIGHAGAGTCMDGIRLHKPMIAVVNDKLMDNHQIELADRLAELGHLKKSLISNLNDNLKERGLLTPKVFQPPTNPVFGEFLTSKLGYC